MFWRHEPTCVVVAVTLIVVMSSLARASRSVLLSRPIDDLLLEQHNIFRQEEKASNIFKMHWNSSVVQAASDWASQCQFKHKLSGPYGENLFYSSDPDFEGFDIREILLEGMELWHDEKRGWTYSSDSCGAACHYTQLVWSTTTSVGCAHQMCHGLTVGRRSVDRALYLVCFYYPRGNWVGEYPFKHGQPCSQCGSGTCKDGLCVEEQASFSSFHKQSENEVKSGSTWNWNYRARGPDAHHQASSFKNVSSVTSRDPASNGFRHTSSHHSQHDVSLQTPSGHHRSRHTSSSVYRVSHSSDSSSGSLGNEFESYNPSRSRLQSLAPAAIRQDPRQAQYARTALERVNNNNNNNNNREIMSDSSSRRSQSPLEVLRADTHWCRDRLPSCRIWTRDCQKSKAVYLACPRTCGHCGRNKDKEKPNALRDRPPPSPQSPPPHPSPSHHPRRTHHQRATQQPRHQNQQQQSQISVSQRQRSQPQIRPSQQQAHPRQQQLQQLRQQQLRQQQLRQQQLRQSKPKPTSQANERLQRPKQQNHLRDPHRNLQERLRGTKNGARRHQKRPGQRRNGQRKANNRQGRRQGPKKGRRPGGPQRGQANGKRRRPLGARKKKGNNNNNNNRRQQRQQKHKKFRNVDRRAKQLAQSLRMKTLSGGHCEDDPKYSRSCPSWVQKGFCKGNALVSDVYCKLSCNSCV